MKKVLTLLVAVVAFSWSASAEKVKKHELTIGTPMEIGTVNLKPGTYQVALENNDLVVFHESKEVAKVPVKVEQLNAKNRDTEILSNPGGKIEEVRFAGENRKLVLSN